MISSCTSFLLRQWCRLPVVDCHSGNISITRLLAAYFAWIVGEQLRASKTPTLNQLWLVLICMACAFGKSTFSFLLDRFKQANPQPTEPCSSSSSTGESPSSSS